MEGWWLTLCGTLDGASCPRAARKRVRAPSPKGTIRHVTIGVVIAGVLAVRGEVAGNGIKVLVRGDGAKDFAALVSTASMNFEEEMEDEV